MSKNLTVELVVSNGRLDRDATIAAFTEALDKRAEELSTEQSEIAAHLTSIFADHKGKSIPMPTLASMVAQRLNAQPENYKTLTERTLDYVRDNSKADDSLFVINKGKNGGASLRADQKSE